MKQAKDGQIAVLTCIHRHVHLRDKTLEPSNETLWAYTRQKMLNYEPEATMTYQRLCCDLAEGSGFCELPGSELGKYLALLMAGFSPFFGGTSDWERRVLNNGWESVQQVPGGSRFFVFITTPKGTSSAFLPKKTTSRNCLLFEAGSAPG